MAIKCCKGCVAPKRYPGCHGHCPEYQKEKAEYDKLKAIADKEKFTDQAIYHQRTAAVERATKNRRYSQKNYRRGGKNQ